MRFGCCFSSEVSNSIEADILLDNQINGNHDSAMLSKCAT